LAGTAVVPTVFAAFATTKCDRS